MADSITMLQRIVATPQPRFTARQTIERRLGRDIGPLATMPRDLRDALYRLQLQLVRHV